MTTTNSAANSMTNLLKGLDPIAPKAVFTILSSVRDAVRRGVSKREAQDILWNALGRDLTIDESALAQRVWQAG